jgi:streptogramin lyase
MKKFHPLVIVALGLSLSGCGGGSGSGAFVTGSTTGTGTTTTSTTPTVAALSPTYSTAASGTVVTVTGTNFSSASRVMFGKVLATSFTVVSSTEITAAEPVGAGVVDVLVTTPQGTSAASTSDSFTYQLTGHTVVITGSIGVSGTAAGDISSPNGVAVGTDGSVYVADSGNNRVDVFTSTGTFVRDFTVGSSTGTNTWSGISLDSSGNIYLTNSSTNQAFEYSSIGSLIQTIALPTGSVPHAIKALDSGNILIDATGTNEILEYSSAGVEIGVFPNSFGAAGINTDSTGFVYLSFAKVEKFSVAGVLQSTITVPSGSGSFSSEIAVDTSGDVFAGYDTSSEIIKMTSSGSLLDTIPVTASTIDRTIATGLNGQLYVPDQTNNRIDIYAAS